ncbi:hypothetical protein GCM10020220_065410 [Nonomuraea rubra]
MITAPSVLPPLPGLDVVTLPTDRGRRSPQVYDPVRLTGLRRPEPPPPPFPPDPARPVVITVHRGQDGGRPKGVVFGNRQLEAIRAHGAGLRWGTGDARLVPYPLGQLGFATRLPVFLQTGRTCHVVPEWTPDAVLRVLREHKIGVLQGEPVPAVAHPGRGRGPAGAGAHPVQRRPRHTGADQGVAHQVRRACLQPLQLHRSRAGPRHPARRPARGRGAQRGQAARRRGRVDQGRGGPHAARRGPG